MGLAGVRRGKKVRTTVGRKEAAAGDRVNRQFVAERPDLLWVADFTYVSTGQGFAYVAFIIDVFAGRIVGWRVSSSMETAFVLDALEQALWAGRPTGTIHHSDKGSQYVSLAYTQRLKDAELLASTGSTGDSYDNAMAESINGLYKAEVIHRQSWKSRSAVEQATLTWVDWYNNRRLLERLGHIPPTEAERSALTGRASRLRRSGSLHGRCSPLYSAPCIYRAPPNVSSPLMTAGTATLKNTATASASGPGSPLSAYSPVVPALWVSAATAVPYRTVPTPASSARAVNQRPAVPAA